MPTRILSWQQMVLEADPDWVRNSLNPLVWEFSNGRLFEDPAQVYAPFPAADLLNDGGVVQLVDPTGWPSSPIGLSAGQIWNNGLAVAIVPGYTPFPTAPPLMFAGLTASQLLRFGAANCPLLPRIVGQLWNNGGELSVYTTPLPTDSLINDGGFVVLVDGTGWPSSSVGLSHGQLWNNGGLVSAIPGGIPTPGAQPLAFFGLTASQLMIYGGGNMPTSLPAISGLIWNNGGVVCVS